MASHQFGIPKEVIEAIRLRDGYCAYCGKKMLFPYDRTNARDSATIEHLNFDGPLYWKDGLVAEDIVICCGSCNSSRGIKRLEDWFASAYCLERGISAESVSEAVRNYLKRKAAEPRAWERRKDKGEGRK